ncbi:MAG: M28 family peptidase [Chitinophagales bacterium]|jgi:hypothetical protein|nr:M28 family peptidase [Chitinophagales bacterium]
MFRNPNVLRIILIVLATAFILPLLLPAFKGCSSNSDNTSTSSSSTTNNSAATPPPLEVKMPDFNGDTAYQYVKKQVDFGPRIMGSAAQKQCAEWLANSLRKVADTVYVQKTTVTNYAKKQYPCYNVIGAFNPKATKRIAIFSHWDSRPRADQDTERTAEAILGADDGGSSTGVALELARILSQQKLQNIGVDIILFDAEDDGTEGNNESYCLGSQHWSRNPHIAGYHADYGILMDMVGAADAIFYKEQYSMQYAPQVVQKVWDAARALGQSSLFSDNIGGGITDDHVFVNTIAHIPTIDIINFQPDRTGFPTHWHTHKDDMKVISPITLDNVGSVIARVLYQEDAMSVAQ